MCKSKLTATQNIAILAEFEKALRFPTTAGIKALASQYSINGKKYSGIEASDFKMLHKAKYATNRSWKDSTHISFTSSTPGDLPEDDTPIATVILLISIAHSFQLLTIYSIVRALTDCPNYLSNNKFAITVSFFVFSGINYLLLYNKGRWQEYLSDFKNETESEKRKGTKLVIAYLLGSVLLFFVLIPLILGI